MKQVAQFNDANLLASLTYTTKAQQPFEIAYDYTKNGNISKDIIQGTATTYEYDGNNQLTKETFANGDANTYEYDAVGNRTAAHVNGKDFTFSYNDANQIEKKNDTAYQYDKDGNLLQDEHFKYTYNEAQRLTSVQTLKGDVVASYTYDENGLRLTKTVGDIIHEYFYNDEVLDMEVVKKNGDVTQYRYYEWNGYTPLGMIVKEKDITGNLQTKAYQFITNHRGDVLSIRDQEDQEVGSYRYDAYGNVLSVEGDVAKDNPIRYAGYYYDAETKNYYLQARYYNPENGAFLALDPHPGDDNEPLSQNGYTYGNDNPVMNVDSNGNNSLRKGIQKAIKKSPKWVRGMLHELFPNKRGYIIKKATINSIAWGTAGALFGEVVVKLTWNGKVTTLRKHGKVPIGSTAGYIAGAHVGFFAALPLASVRFAIGVYLFG